MPTYLPYPSFLFTVDNKQNAFPIALPLTLGYIYIHIRGTMTETQTEKWVLAARRRVSECTYTLRVKKKKEKEKKKKTKERLRSLGRVRCIFGRHDLEVVASILSVHVFLDGQGGGYTYVNR